MPKTNLKLVNPGRNIARPLKALIPMIQSELQLGNDSGRAHYEEAGRLLIEAKDQVGHGAWGRWLTKHFDLTDRTARAYMAWARHRNRTWSVRNGIRQYEPYAG
jgi:hypothetical protein